MKPYKLIIAACNICLMLYFGSGRLFAAQPEVELPGLLATGAVATVNDEYNRTIPTPGGTITIDLTQKLDVIYANTPVEQRNHDLKFYCSGDQKMQFSCLISNYKRTITITFEANPGIETLKNTLVVEVIPWRTDPTTFRYDYNFSQAPASTYVVGAIIGEKVMEDVLYNTVNDVRHRTVSYFDRAGRLNQKIALGASPTNKDVVSFFEYDCMGRGDSISYMPYSIITAGGVKRSNPRAEQKSFYQDIFTSPDDYNYAYSGKEYERSPLGVVNKSGSPGKLYSLDGGTDSHTVTYTNRLNVERIYKYIVVADSCLASGTPYASGSLIRRGTTNDATDEQVSSTYEYLDSEGRVVAKEKYMQNRAPIMTYYVYDDMGRLRYIIPPDLHDKLYGVNAYFPPSSSYRKYWYYNEYDKYGRIVKSSKPGKEAEYFVYNEKGQIVLSQDGNMRAENKWVYCHYDIYGREVQKSIIKDTGTPALSRTEIQTLFDTNTFPGLSSGLSSGSRFYLWMILGYSSYDTYNGEAEMDGLQFKDVDGVVSSNMLAVNNKGRLLYEFLTTLFGMPDNQTYGAVSRIYYYDKKGQLIQHAEYDLNTSIKSYYSTKYDFAGNPLTTVETHTKDSYPTDTKRVDFVYDNQGRLLREITTVNSLAPVAITYTYDELGTVASKQLGNTGVVEKYTHNLQGMLTNQSSGKISMTYCYDEILAIPNQARYDGKLNSMIWNSKQGQRAYIYEYDEHGQLVNGKFLVFPNQTNTQTFEEYVQYDKSGNITNLKRYGATTADLHTYTYNYDGYQMTAVTDTKDATSVRYDYGYDANGNMTFDGRKNFRYTYNCLDLLSGIILNGRVPVVIYDWLSDGTKVAAYARGGDRFDTRLYKGSFTYGSSSTIFELESVSYGGGQFVMTGTGSAQRLSPTYMITDRLGSVRVVMDESGGVIAQNDYYPFGLAHNSYIPMDQLVSNRFRFNGNEQQKFYNGIETGLLDYGSRMYDPVLGRWFSQDPAYQLINPYLFCGNDPINYIDPDGEWFWQVLIGGVANLLSDVISGNLNKNSSWKEWALSFGVGALTGLVGFQVGGALAKAGVGGFFNGMLSGATSGFTSGFATGTGRGLIRGQSFADSFADGMKQGLNGAWIGGSLGGMQAGVASAIQGNNFFNGANYKTEVMIDRNNPYIQQNGDADCGGAVAESVSRGEVTQESMRAAMGGGDNNTVGFKDRKFWTDFGTQAGRAAPSFEDSSVSNYIKWMQGGGDVAFSIKAAPNDLGINGHAVLANRVSTQTITRVNGRQIVRRLIYVMDPSRNGGQYVRFDTNTILNAFQIYPKN